MKIHHENQKKGTEKTAPCAHTQSTKNDKNPSSDIPNYTVAVPWYVLTVFYLIIFNQSVRSLFIAGRERDTLEPSWHLWKGGMKESHPTIFDTARLRRLRACQTATFTVLLHHPCQQRYRFFEVNTIQSEWRVGPQLIFFGDTGWSLELREV